MPEDIRVLGLVLSNDQVPWNLIEEYGQMQTFGTNKTAWIEFVWYRGLERNQAPRLLSLVGRLLNVWYSIVFSLNLRHRRGPRHFLGSKQLNMWISRTCLSCFESGAPNVTGDVLTLPVPELRSFIGIKTLLAFKHALENYDFDYLLRTNSSSYINAPALYALLSRSPRSRYFGGVMGDFFGERFTSGAAYILSRDVLESLVQVGFNKWEHQVVDDVAISRVIASENLADEVELSRITVDSMSALDRGSVADFRNEFHFRCKTGDAKSTIQIMRNIHKLLEKGEGM